MSNEQTMIHRWGPMLAVGALLLTILWAVPQSAQAIPAFARKYGTSCQTCHIAYPKLNAFGEAFRLRGYQLPNETEDLIKSPDVPLGSEGYKRVFPDAVWPGAIPGQPPISLIGEFLIQNSSSIEEQESAGAAEPGTPEGQSRTIVHNDFLFPEGVDLVAAGSLGDMLAFFGELEFDQEAEDGQITQDVSIGHADVRVIRPVKGSPAFNVKIGAFQPELVNTFDHARRLTVANYDAMFGVGVINPGGAAHVGAGGHHGGGGGIALPGVARGIECFGIVQHRAFWALGLVNGLEAGASTFDANAAKDVYGRLAYKLGGMALDGSNAATYTSNPRNWQERSVRLGVFGYRGDGKGAPVSGMSMGDESKGALQEDGESALEDRLFTRVGADVSAFYRDLNLFGAYVHGRDELRAVEARAAAKDEDEGTGDFSYDAFFTELDAVLHYPWLHGAARYEFVDLPGSHEGEGGSDWQRGVFSVTSLVRANFKVTAEFSQDLNESDNYQMWLEAVIAF